MSDPVPATEPIEATEITRYHRQLFALVATATFFEGFDQTILSVVTPYVARDFGITPDRLGILLAAVGAGAAFAIFLTALADRIGRRNLLLITVVGYAVLTGLTAFSRGMLDFALYQFFARFFLAAEYVTAIVIIAEEFPSSRRGFVLGVTVAMALVGATLCALLLQVMMGTALGWRAMYLVGLLPLFIVLALRLRMKETRRFQALRDRRARGREGPRSSLFEVWRPPHRRYLVSCILLFGFISTLINVFTSFYTWFLVNERGFSAAEVSTSYALAMLTGIPAIPLAGWLMDRWGRRVVGVVGPLLASVGMVVAFNAVGSYWTVTAAGMAGVFIASFVVPIQVSYATELFPTRLRAIAGGWIANGAGRCIAIAAPALTGLSATLLGSVSAAATVMAGFGIAAAGLVYFRLPETRARTLEDSSGDGLASE